MNNMIKRANVVVINHESVFRAVESYIELIKARKAHNALVNALPDKQQTAFMTATKGLRDKVKST